MKRASLYLLASLLLCFTSARGVPGEADWKKVEELIVQKQPKEALAALAPMETVALTERAWPEAVRAIALRIQIEGGLERDRPEIPLMRIDEALGKAPAEMFPLLQTLAANWYAEYLNENSWKIMHRTPGGSANDVAAWDLKRLLAEIDARFQKALSTAAVLKQTPVAKWDGLIKAGKLPDSYQPTLYDFIMREALGFYTATEQAGAEEYDTFEFADSSPAVGTMEEFLAWEPGQGTSPKLQGIRLFKELLTFHKDDADPGARVLVDIERLEWAGETATGTEGAARARQQISALAQKHASHEVSLRARAQVAEGLLKDHKAAEARKILQEGVAAHGNSVFAPYCRNKIKGIESRELLCQTEMVWNAAQPDIAITHRNLKKVYFRLYMAMERPEPAAVLEEEDGDEEKLEKVLASEPARAWAVDLPGAEDFMEHSLRVPAPVDLKAGIYYLGSSANEGFSEDDNEISYTRVWVTPLAVVTRDRDQPNAAGVEGWVLDAVSGEPVSGAEVSLWVNDYTAEKAVKAGTAKTGADGFVSFVRKKKGQVYLFAKHGGNTAMSGGSQLIPDDPFAVPGQKAAPGRQTSTFFFTDRALYRPGQTIQFKGIHVLHDTDKASYKTLPNVKRRVVLKDNDGREWAAADAVTNAYGSFSGSFIAPQQGLTGAFRIDDGQGTASIQVEEYKRPEFRVEVDPPAAAPKLGEEVTVKIKAVAYTGAAVDGADVKWRVKRMPVWPSWADWGRILYPNNTREVDIAQGEVKTGTDGSVEIKFTALPDKSIDEKSEPWFRYSVHADITDTAGETRSAEREVKAGYAAMKAELRAEDWQTTATPVGITVDTTSLDDEPQKAEGVLTVHRLVQPDKVHRRVLDGEVVHYGTSDFALPETEPKKDLSDPNSWETGEVVQRDDVKTDDKGEAKVPVKLAAGAYRAILETKDRFGKKVTAQLLVMVVDPAAQTFPVRAPFMLNVSADSLQPGDEFTALWGTGYEKARAFIEIEHRGKVVQRFWTDPARTQQGLTMKVTEAHRGGFHVRVMQMRENRFVTESQFIDVPWANKDLSLKWEHLTSKLEPGAKETWTLTVEGPDKEKIDAELAAVLYDASLDAFAEHSWMPKFSCFYSDGSMSASDPEYAGNEDFPALEKVAGNWELEWEDSDESGRRWPWDRRGRILEGLSRSESGNHGIVMGAVAGAALGGVEGYEPPPPMAVGGGSTRNAAVADPFASGGAAPAALSEESSADYTVVPGRRLAKHQAASPVDLSKVSARRNFQETAFFFPHLKTEENGAVKITFTMPEAVTSWKFLGFAHDKVLRSGFLIGETVTARDLMVQPNPPRFLREGDMVEFTVKITNKGGGEQQGTARLNFADAVSLVSADAAVGNQTPEQPFTVPANESRTVAWRITVPDGQGFLTWKAVAGTEKLTDGEEGWLPVLSRRIPVTESMPLPIRDAGTKEFAFKKLMESAGSDSLRHQNLTVQMVSRPAWYAVMALPYLMEFPHECTEQTFNRLYANALARHIAKSDPKVRRVFDVWRTTQPEATKSALERNPELKSVMLEETPWLRDAQKQNAQHQLGVLFDDNRLDSETERLLKQLGQVQSPDGAWPWFQGGPSNEFITLYIVSGFGRLHHLGVEIDTEAAVKALDHLDAWIEGEYQDLIKRDIRKAGSNLSPSIALYLYGRSFFLKQRPIPEKQKEAVDYFLEQARQHWNTVPRMSQAHAALGLLRFGDKKTPGVILISINSRAVSNEELGLYWAETKDLWSWNHAPIETQALMIEAFRDIAKNEKMVEDCQVWLLKQKQTQAWPTTKATADAVYALLLGGTSKLSSDALVTVSLGGTDVKPEKSEAGTGFFEKRFTPGEIKAELGSVKLTKKDKGVAWGSLHWQYMEDVSKITPHEGTPLKVTKALFVKEQTKTGAELKPVTGKVKVGDELVVRIEIRTDRDMEFVHLKDQRPSSVEPVNVLSGYQWQDTLGYYESTRDTASHFFMDSLPKGTFVFEYSSRVQLRGRCQTGIA
ncbi:MAG TPA: alpha-2-macroglobulin family protein, partial [Verrucomicrobiales bacterium]|nr:alpha-2-macroglobulin family protein [Verrucomicrobiales bacterium]